MAVKEILDQIENLVVEAKRVPIMNKIMIDDNDLIHLVDELRRELPLELQKAQQVMQDRQLIIERAQEEADEILKKAKRHAEDLVDSSEIVIAAQDKAKNILDMAGAQEKDIMERTMTNATQLRSDADAYANQVFDHLLSNLGSALDVVSQAKRDLNASAR